MDIQHKSMLHQPAIFANYPGLAAAESTRHGGVSEAPYCALNLGKSTGDRPEHVAENRRRFCKALGFMPDQMAWSKQVHGNLVRQVEAPGGAAGYDALITDTPGVLLCVSVADCTPILVLDARNRALAAIHAGWRGTAAAIVAQTLSEMAARFGTQGADCVAYIGTCIDFCSFEVGPEVAEAFDNQFRQYDAPRGKYFVDLKSANKAQLTAFGVPPDQIEVSPFCTVTHNDRYFSHRYEKGTTGRMLAAIGWQV